MQQKQEIVNKKNNDKFKFINNTFSKFRSKYNTLFSYIKAIKNTFDITKNDIDDIDAINYRMRLALEALVKYKQDIEAKPFENFLIGGLISSIDDFCLDIKIFINVLSSFDYYYQHQIFIPTITMEKYQPAPETLITYEKGLPEDIETSISNTKTFGIGYVSGAKINPFFHALLYVGSSGFFHVSRTNGFPEYMSIRAFNDYIVREKKNFWE